MADRGTDPILSPSGALPVAESDPAPRGRGARMVRALAWVKRYFVEQDPTFWTALTPALIVAALLFVRSPTSNYIFDEQEALLANPYVNGQGLGWLDAFRRDFWGLPPTRSIGSYRPLPDLLWRALWQLSKLPWLHHWLNVLIHAVNAALLAGIVLAATRRRDLSWLAGGVFVTSAVLTEAVTGVVGLADVLGGLGVLLAVVSLRLPMWAMPWACFASLVIGLFSKESVIVAVPLIGWAALLLAPLHFPAAPRRVLRALFAVVAAVAALVLYTYVRRRFFPVTLPPELAEPLPDSANLLSRGMHEFLRWFQQPKLPRDPMNNPLVDADFPHRVAGALRVYASGLGQVLLPWTLSGDYSYPQEPVPERLVFPGSVIGAVGLVGMPLLAIALWVWSLVVERRAGAHGPRHVALSLLALGLLWIPVAYFPHSNIPVLLPTVRAERFWYLPVMGAALILAVVAMFIVRKLPHYRLGVSVVVAFFTFQAMSARLHALDYTDDLMFWRATRAAVPNSAKAHLNYSVMVGAHLGDLEQRLAINARAKELAPLWPMAHIYYGDTLCRMNRPDEAWPHYERGFELAPNDPNLIALALQCLWDKGGVPKHKEALLELSRKHPGSWIAYFATEIVYRGEEHGGIEKKYRPRGYDEGPRDRD